MKKRLYNNIANILTLIRFLCTIYVLYIAKELHNTNFNDKVCLIYVILCVIIWGSDFFDGKIARKLDIVSPFGACFDVIVDFIFVFFTHIQLVAYHIMPVWGMFIIIEKIADYFITSKILSKIGNHSFEFIPDTLGRIVAALFYFTPMLMWGITKYHGKETGMIGDLLIVIAILAGISSLNRISFLIIQSVHSAQGVKEGK